MQSGYYSSCRYFMPPRDKVALPCQSLNFGKAIILDSDDNEPTDVSETFVSCTNAQMTEIVMDPTPWIIAINCDKNSHDEGMQPSGVDSCHHAEIHKNLGCFILSWCCDFWKQWSYLR